jgi:hypothetical protein
MKDVVTFVIIVRDREACRVQDVVDSVRENGADPSFIVIDYGSTKVFASQYVALCACVGLRYERVLTQGQPWNRSHAINCGARLAGTKFVVASDVDMLYTSNPIKYCLDHFSGKKMYHIDTYWLPKDGNRTRARFAGHGTPGPFQFISRTAFDESGGYDERIKYWGQEDLDWTSRLRALGYEQEWLPEPHRLYHQWHNHSGNGFLRPETASFDTMSYCLENRMNPILMQDWGKATTSSDRPILACIEKSKPIVVRIARNEFEHYENLDLLVGTREHGGFVKLELDNRVGHMPMSRFSKGMKSIFNPFVKRIGLECTEKLNTNIDYLFSMLPTLTANGLLDYFISTDMSTVYLFWE